MKFLKKMWVQIFYKDSAREKKLADINNEPWVKVIKIQLTDSENSTPGYFELDWNYAFVDHLIESGYSGRTPEEVVDMWFNDLCRGMIGEDTANTNL